MYRETHFVADGTAPILDLARLLDHLWEKELSGYAADPKPGHLFCSRSCCVKVKQQLGRLQTEGIGWQRCMQALSFLGSILSCHAASSSVLLHGLRLVSLSAQPQGCGLLQQCQGLVPELLGRAQSRQSLQWKAEFQEVLKGVGPLVLEPTPRSIKKDTAIR